MNQHDSTFVINDIQLIVPPENISINKTGQLKKYKSLRTKGTAKFRSPSTIVTVDVNIKFSGVDAINSTLKPLVAQFLLTPFCSIENQYIKDSIVGTENLNQNLAFALNNLNISTIENLPDTWNVSLSFVLFNYNPYSKDFSYKTRLFTKSSIDKNFSPAVSNNEDSESPFQTFYKNQLSKLKDVSLLNSFFEMGLLEFQMAPEPPTVDVASDIKIDFAKLKDLENSVEEFFNIANQIASNGPTDAIGDISQADMIGKLSGNILPASVNELLSLVDQGARNVKTIAPNNALLSKLLRKQEEINKTAPTVFNGQAWLEFPIQNFGPDVKGDRRINKVSAKTQDGSNKDHKLYYRTRTLGSDNIFDTFKTGLVATSININFSHKLAVIPMQGYNYPTMQHLGSEDVQFSVSFACLDDETNRRFTDFWNVAQNNLLVNKQIPQDLLGISINNELFQFMGVNDVLIEEANVNTAPQQPGLYIHNFSFIENSFRINSTEQFVSVPTSYREVRKAVWRAIWNNVKIKQFLYSQNNFIINFIPFAEDNASDQLMFNLVNRGIFTIDSTNLETSLNRSARDLYTKLAKQEKIDNVSLFQLLPGLTDDKIMGIEGLVTTVNSKAPELDGIRDTFGLSKMIPGTPNSDVLSFTPEQAASKLNLIEKERKNLLAAHQLAMDEFSLLRSELSSQNGFTIDDNLIIRTEDGTTIDFKEKIKDPALIRFIQEEMQSTFLEDLKEGAIEASKTTAKIFIGGAPGLVSVIADANTPSSGDGLFSNILQRKKFLNAMEKVENKLNGFIDKTESSPFDVFNDWNTWAVKVADTIIEQYIYLPMFKEAKKLLEEMEAKTKRSLYADMEFDKVKEIILSKANALGINPEEFDLEPDFYFWNETIDNPNSNKVDGIVIDEIKKETQDYYLEMFKSSKDWYNKKYLNKVNPEFQRFLKLSHETGESEPISSSAVSIVAPGRHQITKDHFSKSDNVFINSSGKLDTIAPSIKDKLSKNEIRTSLNASVDSNNKPIPIEKLKPGINDLAIFKQPTSSTEALNEAVGNFFHSAETISANSGWVHPLPGAQITSKVGYRTHPVSGNISFHRGTDLAYGSAALTMGQPVYATLSGTVVASGHGGGEGIFVNIKSEYSDPSFDTVVHRYYHLQGIGFKSDGTQWSAGDEIKAGEILGFVGNTGVGTGPHLHFEVEVPSNSSSRIFIYPFEYESNFLRETTDTGESGGYFIIKRPQFIPYTGIKNPALPRADIGEVNSMSSFELAAQRMQLEQVRVSGYRMNRAYPSIYLAFIEEDLEDSKIYKFDDYFSFSSIVNMYMVKDREVPADYVAMELSNLSGMLSNRRYRGTFNENNPISNGREAKEVDRTDPTKVDTEEEFKFESMVLREGIKVEIRLGYSNNPDNNEIAFIGRITGVEFSDADDIVFVEMQSLATELVQDIKGQAEADVKDGWFVTDARTGPMLEELIASPECVSFGYWQRGDKDKNTNRSLLTDRWTWNPAPSSDNIFAPLSDDLDPRKWLLGTSLIEKALFGVVSAGAIGAASAAILGGSFVAGAFGGITGIGGATVGGTTLLGSAFQPQLEAILKFQAPFSNMKYYVYQTTIWDVFKEMEHRHPDCISSPVPYIEKLGGRTRMTMFFGNPDWLYFARDPSNQENFKTQEINNKKKKLNNLIDSKLISSEEKIKSLREFSDSVDSSELFKQEQIIKEALLSGDTQSAETSIKNLNRFIEQALLDKALENSSIRPFRTYHLVTSAQHIISNNITAKSSNAFNAVTIRYADDGADDTEIDKNNEVVITDVEELTMKLDPLIPDEYVREAVFTYPNCQGARMAKRYAVSHLQKSCWQIYEGDLVILGNPTIKPYDIVFIYDEYTRTIGPVQVRRIVHTFDASTGFISVITPDLLTTVTEGALLTELQAMGLMSEYYLGFDNVIEASNNPFKGPKVDILKSFVGSKLLGVASLFGMKKMLFINQFGHPIRIHPLLKDGQAMVAGFGPPGVRENEFIINDAKQWVSTRYKAASQSMEDIFSMFENREGIFNTRGTIFGKR